MSTRVWSPRKNGVTRERVDPLKCRAGVPGYLWPHQCSRKWTVTEKDGVKHCKQHSDAEAELRKQADDTAAKRRSILWNLAELKANAEHAALAYIREHPGDVPEFQAYAQAAENQDVAVKKWGIC